MAGSESNDTTFERPEEGNPLLRWREYLHVFYERRWIAIATFLVVVVSATIWNARQVPIYRASARLQIDMSAERILNIPDFANSGTPGYMFGQYIKTQIKALRSRTFIERVAAVLAGSEEPDVKALVAHTPNLAGRILGGLSVGPVEGTLLIDITVQDPDRKATALLANAVAEQFIQQDLNRRMDSAMSALTWLSRQADDQKAKVTASELAVQAYREKSGMVSLEDRQDIVVSKLKAVNESLTRAETALATAQSQRQEVDALVDRGVALEDIPAIAADPLVVSARKAITDLETSLTTLSLRYKGKHPTLIAAKADLEEARAALAQVCRDARARIERAYQLAQSNADGLRAALKEQESQALSLSRVLVEYNELKRNAEADRELYESILTRMKETDLAGKLETTNIRINDRAHVPARPFKPHKLKNILQAAAVGLVLGILLVLVVHLMDDRVRRVEDFELSLGIPVLAMVPRVELPTAAERATVVLTDVESQPSETFRGLRASLLLDSVGREAHCIMVVSASAAEGKSLVAANMAAIFAQNGERTLLIDGDLRRPSVHKLMHLNDRKGFPDLLEGKAAWEEAVSSSPHESLDIMTGHGASRDPAPLLASARLGPVLQEARKRYDRIVVDCPPLFGVSDSLLLLSHVDGVVLVALYNRTHRRAIAEASQKLLDGEAPILGAVINGVEFSSHSYYYHRYGYKYYYGRRAAGQQQG